MGNLGIGFNEPPDYLAVIKKQVQREALQVALKEKAKKQALKYTVNEGAQDSLFQRFLAWSSYFVMVFVALCAFNAPARAMISEVVETGPKVEISSENTSSQSWELRTSND